ncbi:MAG: hypothetical protein GOU99_02135 [Candidatus Altiarchaeota archaeon]|nr:hypothetical protein [Candidatus Altiarchaeota archaeon]
MHKKRILVVIPSIVIGVVLLISLLLFLGVPINSLTKEYCGCHHVMPNYYYLIFGFFLILAMVPLSYYFISKKMENRMEEHKEILVKFVDQKLERSIDNNPEKLTVLNLLNPNERKITENLIKHGGVALQSEISKMDGMTKLKAHRAVKNLETKGIVKTEKHGKTNKLVLSKKIKNLLKEWGT